jgi:hypothetical protein
VTEADHPGFTTITRAARPQAMRLQDVRVLTTVPAPVELYDEIHRGVGATVDSLLVHVGRATTDGFQRWKFLRIGLRRDHRLGG